MAIAMGVFTLSAIGQNNTITQVWIEGNGNQAGTFGAPTATDAQDNVYRAGFEKLSNGGTMAKLQKIDNEGQLQWTADFNPSGTIIDRYEPSKVVLNGADIYVSGMVTYTATNQSDFFISKINASGSLQWLTTNQASGNDVAADMMYDAATSQIYICGTTQRNGNYDMLLAAYDDGVNEQWIATKDFNGHADVGAKVFRDGSNIVVQGSSQSSPVDWYIASWLYTDGGSYINHGRVTGLNAASDELNDGALHNNHILLTGKTSLGGNTSFKVACLDANNNLLWQDAYNKNNAAEEGLALTPTNNGFVAVGYVTTTPGNEDILIRKYDLNGNALWHKELDLLGENDRALDVVEDSDGNYIVLSNAEANGQKDVYMTLIQGTTGNDLWSQAVAESPGEDEIALNIEATFGGEMYVTYQTGSQTVTESYSYSDVNFPMDNEPFSRGSLIIANSGQLKDENGNSATDVRYYTFGQSPEMYYADQRMSALVLDDDTSTNQVQRIDFDFVGANPTHVGEVTEHQKDPHFNYYEGTEKYELQGTFDVLAYPDLYPGIDAFISTNSEGFKMTFVLENGADLNDIIMDINGSSGFALNGNDLQVSTIASPIIWLQPYSYPRSDVEKNNDGCIQYNLAEGDLRLSTGCGELSYPYVITLRAGVGMAYNPSAIDNMDWSTFFGGDAHEGCYDVEVDNNGDIYVAGFTTSISWSLNTGIQGLLTGNGQGLICKFDHGGDLKWNAVIDAGKGSLVSQTPLVSIKGLGLYENNSSHTGKEIHFIGQYIGDLPPSIATNNGIPATAYSQTNGTIPANSIELLFGTLNSSGVLLMITPFGGNEIDEVHAMDITSDGKMYFAGSTMSDGDQSAHGSRTPPTAHTFPVFDPQDNSFFESTHPDPGNKKRGFVSVIDLNPNSANQYQLAYSSLITKDPSSTNTPYEAIYDIEIKGSDAAYCGKGVSYGRVGIFNPSSTLFAKDLDQQFSEWPDKTYFSSVVPGFLGGTFIGIDEDGTNDPLISNGSTNNMYQATAGEAYLVRFVEGSVTWDTYFGQSAEQQIPWSVSQNYMFGFYDDIQGKGKLAYNNTTRTLFAAGSASSSPVETKSKPNFFTETTIDGVHDLEDIYLAAFTTKGINHNYFNWGTIYGGSGSSLAGGTGAFGKDYLADVVSYDVGNDSYVLTVATGFSIYGSTTSDVEKYPVAQLPNSYFQSVTGNASQYADMFITRYKVTDIDNQVSIEEFSNRNSVAWIYPNPTNDYLNISLKENNELEKVEVYDINGRVIKSQEFYEKSNATTFNIAALATGIYFIKINGRYVQKVVKQ